MTQNIYYHSKRKESRYSKEAKWKLKQDGKHIRVIYLHFWYQRVCMPSPFQLCWLQHTFFCWAASTTCVSPWQISHTSDTSNILESPKQCKLHWQLYKMASQDLYTGDPHLHTHTLSWPQPFCLTSEEDSTVLCVSAVTLKPGPCG